MVQKRFLSFMYKVLNKNTNNNYDLDYFMLCDLYRLPTLEHRRSVNDCLFLYRFFHNIYTITDSNPFCLHVPVRRTRHAQEHILHIPRSRVEVTKRGFISRISSTYNRLHGMCDVFGAPSVKSFRRQVHAALSTNAT